MKEQLQNEPVISTSSGPSFGQSLIAGGIAGTSVDIALFPLDTMKTRLQAKEGFLAAGGFRGVYRGLGSVVVGSAPAAALFFTGYEYLNSHLPILMPALSSPDAGVPLHMIAASGGEVSACLVRVPTEVVKQRQQTWAYGQGSSFAAVKHVISESGFSGLFRGFTSTVAREIPFCCIQFPLYERLKIAVGSQRGYSSGGRNRIQDLPAWPDSAACGSMSGAIAAAITTPLDVAKTRIMLSRGQAQLGDYDKTATTLRRIYFEEGFTALFKGVVPRVIWLSMGGAVFLGVYEAAKSTLRSLHAWQ